MRSSKRYDSDTAFKDMLFNIILIIGTMFVLMFVYINPPSIANKNIDAKGDYMIRMEWDPESMSDLDLWIRDPLQNIVSYMNKSSGLMLLDVDDLGGSTDTITLPDGTTKTINVNMEIVTLRGTVAGKYTTNVFFYSRKDQMNIKAKISLIRINPRYELITETEMQFPARLGRGEERTAFSFVLNEKGDVVSMDNLQNRFVLKDK